MLQRSALAALVLAGVSSAALAQTTTQPSQPSQPSQFSQPPANFGAAPSSALGIYSDSTQMTLLRMSMNDPRSGVTSDQWRRARQSAVLIRTNRCEDAYNMALTEQDFRLALNIAVACKAHLRQ